VIIRRAGDVNPLIAAREHRKNQGTHVPRSPFQGIPMSGSSSNKRCHYLPWCSVVLICCSLTLSGCGSSAESHEDEHDDEHLEHFIPAHKPNSFGDLVEQLALRVPRLTEGGQPTGGSDGGHATALQEFSDIIGWIPELAADSELMRADFESAVATGNRLTEAFAEALGPRKTKVFDAAAFEPLINELRKLVPKSQDRKEQM